MELETIALEELEVLEEAVAPGNNAICGLWC